MPDWVKYIREDLPRDRFRGEMEGEILEQLAGHLEDAYAEALLASYLPARKAARVDPMVALRAEWGWGCSPTPSLPGLQF